MNKSALRNFATNARRELLERVELQARKIGVTKDKTEEASLESSDSIFINGRQLTDVERKQRNKLIARIEEIGFDRVMEETAYTWFNRFIALRFMEVNDYLPTRVRVLSSENEDSTEPDMIKEALSLDLEIDKEYVYDLKMENNTEELFKYLIKLHCNDLNQYMPFMFETIEDFMAILFPEGLLGTDSFVREMTDTEVIPEENWGKVEIIGWLYQYYIAEEKDQVFANLKKNIKITKDTLPAATQLFTPNWIVRYMVENSLGRIWMESNPESSLKSNWRYYLDEAEQNKEVIKQLEEIQYTNVDPEEITFLDPACGSGHILVYAFDILYEMYIEKGYIATEIPKLIIEKNLYGVDVDDRAAQLASFSVMMRAREKSRRIFRQKPKLNIVSIQESNWLTDDMIEKISNQEKDVKSMLSQIKDTFMDAKEYGSLLDTNKLDHRQINERLEKYLKEEIDLFEYKDRDKIEIKLPQLLSQIDILSSEYDVVCTNPPYMGRRSMNTSLTKFLDRNFPDTKADLFSAFIERGFELTNEKGFNSMVTMQSWMFLSTFEKMRNNILENKTITCLLHMDNMVMGIAFGTSATVFRNIYIDNYYGEFREVKYVDLEEDIPKKFPIEYNRKGFIPAKEFLKIPGSPIAFSVSANLIETFRNNNSIGNSLDFKKGMSTGDNARFMKYWTEVRKDKIGFNVLSNEDAIESQLKWFPINSGGEYRKWYGNNMYVVNWLNDGKEMKDNAVVLNNGGHWSRYIVNEQYFFKKGITWSAISSSKFGVRFFDTGFLFSSASMCGYGDENQISIILGLLNSKVVIPYLNVLAPTLNFGPQQIKKIPFITDLKNENDIESLVELNIGISKHDWNSFETSWDFSRHPLLKFPANTIEFSYNQWAEFAENQFNQLKENEEELNRIFIDIYGLQDELTPEVADEDVTVRKADLERDIKSFISYAVGCTFGRYSLDEDGLIYAGGEFDPSRYKSFPADEDNILPILPGAYFEDDIVTRFIEFVEVTYGKETLEENLQFVADAIGRRKNETAREAIRRYFLNNFYKDHVQTYKKHPIYWLFSSGKEKAFNCLIYMHRYDKTTLSRIRTDYLHEVQTRYESINQDLQSVIEGDGTAKEIRDAKKELKDVEKKIDELKRYDEKLHHMADMQIEIDLDDGVKVNYKKFEGLIAKI